MDKDKFSYLLIRALTLPISYLPYRVIHLMGRIAGNVAFYLMREYRKRTLSNLSLAVDLKIQSPEELFAIAKRSFQNLAINCLEYPRFARETQFSRVIFCENPEVANELHKKGQGIIFFCGHQSNWEVLFLDGTTRMKGVAIGKPIKNKRLYHWILKIRQKNGGKIIPPRSAVKEGLRNLRKGIFLGIVGDQGMPDSGYSFPFLGRRAWTSTAPALLSYRTGSPIIVATTRRVLGGYRIRYSDPLYPNPDQPLEQEVIRLMDRSLTLLQESIIESPGEWLWQHNRWKQQTPQVLYKRFRHDSILVILPENIDPLLPHLETLREIYSNSFLFVVAPFNRAQSLPFAAEEVFYYKTIQEAHIVDYRPKLVFNFTSIPTIRAHFERLSAFEVLDIPLLKRLAEPYRSDNLSEILKRALTRSGTLWSPDSSSKAP